jgi:ADP-ribose pyrophosphatase YjhB (NUDIX family)
MVASSILPVSIYRNKLYFLFGKENEFEDSSKGFSDFGGKVEKGESIMETAYREGSEELMGFLGNPHQLKIKIKNSGGTYKINYNGYHVNIFFMKYDPNLPIYYNQHYNFVWNHVKMNKKNLNETKLFEKQEIRWFSIDEMKHEKKLFRCFYVNILDEIISHKSNIYKFITLVKK